MVLDSVKSADYLTSLPGYNCEPNRSRQEFLTAFFVSLDIYHVRYCVLHSWEQLPNNLSSDLDIAVHPDDRPKLKLIFQLLRTKGYAFVQVLNYFVEAYCFRFFWIDDISISSLAIDVIFKHQRGPCIAPSSRSLVAGRRRHGMFWIASPDAEFKYLLAKKSWKAVATVAQQRRLKLLVEQLGRSSAEALAGELFIGKVKARVVAACATEQLGPLLGQLRRQAWKTSLSRNPLRLIEDVFFECMRLLRRWSQPTGFFVTIMGPDGVGKSTLTQHLVRTVAPAFDREKLFHWRPVLLWRRRPVCDSTSPHSLPVRRPFQSISRLCAHLLDYWFGYWLLIRPLLARSGLVVFDRYFDDLMIDPERYRYGGPQWFVRFLRRLIPKPDLVLVLDAPEAVVLSRKQELTPAELNRQRQLYSAYQKDTPNSRLIDTSMSVAQACAESAEAIFACLTRRSEQRYPYWLSRSENS
jgi:thymidylate kinase